MKLLKKHNWWIWLLLSILTLGISTLLLGFLLKVYEKNAWYTNWYYWVLGFFFGLLPGIIMFIVFSIQISVLVCLKLNTPGKEIYELPYTWILLAMIPIVGWTLFVVLFIYTHLIYVISLWQGKGEHYIA